VAVGNFDMKEGGRLVELESTFDEGSERRTGPSLGRSRERKGHGGRGGGGGGRGGPREGGEGSLRCGRKELSIPRKKFQHSARGR